MREGELKVCLPGEGGVRWNPHLGFWILAMVFDRHTLYSLDTCNSRDFLLKFRRRNGSLYGTLSTFRLDKHDLGITHFEDEKPHGLGTKINWTFFWNRGGDNIFMGIG